MNEELLKKFEYYWTMIERKNKINVSDFFNTNDYFTAPASTKYHCSYVGGLLEHSLNVVDYLIELTNSFKLEWKSPDSPIIIGLLHDICKVNYYRINYRKIKNKNGDLIDSIYFTVNDTASLGVHGDKSLLILNMLGFELTEEEMYCIRYHMGAYEGKEIFNLLGNAKKKYPNILFTYLADELAVIKEEKNEQNN